MGSVPVLSEAAARKLSIIYNTPAVFNIEENPRTIGEKPVHEIEIASEVQK